MRKYTSPLVSIVVIALGGLLAVVALGWSPELGLDLQGGASVILEPREEATSEQLDVASQIIRDRVDSLGVAEPEIRIQGDSIVVELPGVKDQAQALELVGKTGELRFRPVLGQYPGTATAPETTTTIAGATTTTIAGATTTVAGASAEVTTTAAEGTTTTGAADAPTTTAQASTTTVAADTTAGGPGEARPRLRTATTEPATSDAPTTTVASSSDSTAPGDTSATGDTVAPPATDPLTVATAPPEQFVPEVDDSGLLAITPREGDTPEATVVLPEYDGDDEVARYILGPTAFNGSIVSSASATFPTNEWIVELEVKGGAEGIDLWNALAAECYEGTATCPPSGGLTGQIAVVLDGRVISAPAVQPDNRAQGVGFQPFQADQISISGGFKEDEARELTKFLNYGALPVDLEPQAVQTVSATLGKDSLRAGIVAGAIGIGLVVVLMLLYYRSLGIVVLLGLCVSGALLYSIIAWLGEQQGLALTLAGATGIIVSVGVTVDSYVVYFERLKDDVRAGRSLRASAERGFKQAYRTIVAADVVSLIGAFLLWYLTVGGVRGFAFFLGLSAIIDLIVAYFFTRPLVAILARTKRFSGTSVLGVVTGEAKVAASGGAA